MEISQISGLVLAAGQSSRMGQSKLTLPWGGTSVIGKVVSMLLECNISSIYVITGGNRKELESKLLGYKVQFIHNENHAIGEMLSSVKVGLKSLPENINAVLIVLGDQPQIEASVVQQIVDVYINSKATLIVPSYQMHRGHPWLVERHYWDQILQTNPTDSLRDFLQANQAQITYVNVNTPSILMDLDTPQDYFKYRPGESTN